MRCGVYEYERGEARKFAHRAVSALVRLLCVAALALAVSAVPTEAKKKPNPIEEKILDSADGEPLTLVVSLRDQRMDLYRGITLITTSRVSTGTPGYPTKTGVFSILEKQRYHHSNMYSAAPMPWMQRLTWSGTALHGGVVPGYPASHGCIRLPFSFAPKLFEITIGGENVVVARDRPAPTFIEHPTLFQPVPPVPADVEKQTDANSTEHKALDEASEDHGIDTSEPAVPKLPTDTVPHANDVLVDPSNESSSIVVAPLRILVTRRTERDRIIDLQYLLSSMGYLTPQKFSGRLGKETVAAIRAFQKANGMPETGTFNDKLAKEVYKVAGKEEPPEGHLFVRQQFRPVFDVPISFRNPEQPLGTHVFTALFAAGDTKSRWMAISLEGDDATRVLDRIQIPTDVRQKIANKLAPGSSLIVADKSINSAILPEGADFLVLAKDTPTVAQKSEAKVKHARIGQTRIKRSKTLEHRNTRERTARAYGYDRLPDMDRPRPFFRWRWRRCEGIGC
jgi:peptidoglycan hydrolase-like protein with peptidoglycan-binding domain